MRRLVILLLTLSLPFLVMGCGSKQYWSARSAHGGGVQIEPTQAWVGGHKLWVRVTVVNGTSEGIRVVRDNVTCILPDGHKIARASGSSTSHAAYFIPAGGSHAVFVEFEEVDFDWHTVPKVTVDFSKGIFAKNEQPVTVDPMEITNSGDAK